MTLLLRAATRHDVDTIRELLAERTVHIGEQVVVLTDITAPDGAVVRGVAVIRETARRWLVVAAAVDGKWPPAAAALVEQLRSMAIAQGVDALVFRPACSPAVLAEVLSDAVVDVGGAVTIAL